MSNFICRRSPASGHLIWTIFQVAAGGSEVVLASFTSEAECMETVQHLSAQAPRITELCKRQQAMARFHGRAD